MKSEKDEALEYINSVFFSHIIVEYKNITITLSTAYILEVETEDTNYCRIYETIDEMLNDKCIFGKSFLDIVDHIKIIDYA